MQLICIGGFFNPQEMCTFGVLAEDMLARMRFNKLFLGCRGIDPEAGITSDLQSESKVDVVITDSLTPEPILDKLRKQETQVIVAASQPS